MKCKQKSFSAREKANRRLVLFLIGLFAVAWVILIGGVTVVNDTNAYRAYKRANPEVVDFNGGVPFPERVDSSLSRSVKSTHE